MKLRRPAARLLAVGAAAVLLASAALAEPLEDYEGRNRLLVVFTPSVIHDLYDRQMQTLLRHSLEVRERDLLPVEVVGVEPVRIDALTQPEIDPVALRERFDAPEDSFKVVLLGKDGTVKLTAQTPLSAEKLFATIDAMPLRQREMEETAQ